MLPFGFFSDGSILFFVLLLSIENNFKTNTFPMTAMSASAKSLTITLINIALSVVLSWALLGKLADLNKDKQFAQEKVETVTEPAAAGDSTATADSTKRIVITPLPTEPEEGKTLVNFLDILVLMLIAGALGGVLCNLRGIFVYYRDEGGLPEDYAIPYLVRPFTAGVCGLFIYFVLSLIITSITLVPVAEGIGFQGTVSYISLAIVAGFGAQEFMERLKEVAKTLFGVDKERSAVQKMRDWKRQKDLGLITEEQYNQRREQVMANADTPSDEFESLKQPQQPSDKQGA